MEVRSSFLIAENYLVSCYFCHCIEKPLAVKHIEVDYHYRLFFQLYMEAMHRFFRLHYKKRVQKMKCIKRSHIVCKISLKQICCKFLIVWSYTLDTFPLYRSVTVFVHRIDPNLGIQVFAKGCIFSPGSWMSLSDLFYPILVTEGACLKKWSRRFDFNI